MNNKNENNFVACVVYKNVSINLRFYFKNKVIIANVTPKKLHPHFNLVNRQFLLTKKQLELSAIYRNEIVKTYP